MAYRFGQQAFHHPPTGSPPANQPLAADGTSSSLKCADYRDKTVQIGGTFTATVQLQGSIDGSTWLNIGSSVSAPAFIAVTQAVQFLRLVISGYSAGTVVALFGGLETRIGN